MAEYIKSKQGKIHLNKPIQAVVQDQNGRACGVRLESHEEVTADFVVSTMPLTQMVMGLKAVPEEIFKACQQLYYRNTILVYLDVDSKMLFPDQWIYVHSPEVRHGRITNFRNWCESLQNGKESTILCLEYWCFEKDDLWKMTESELGKVAEKELLTLGLLSIENKVTQAHVLKVAKSYPVYQTGYAEPLGKVQNYVSSIQGLLAIGRYGAFKYNNQDHSILMGLLAAKQIITGIDTKLWMVNSDDEYQEGAKISDIQIAEAATE